MRRRNFFDLHPLQQSARRFYRGAQRDLELARATFEAGDVRGAAALLESASRSYTTARRHWARHRLLMRAAAWEKARDEEDRAA